ncbi:MAG: YdiY family protein [Blastocatellales bacterium]
MSTKRVLATLFMAAVSVTATLADEVRLKNGDRLTGTIVKSDGKSLVLKTDYAGAVTIAADQIERITSDQALYFSLGEEKTVVGKVEAREGKYEVETKDAGKVEVEAAEIKAIRSEAEHEAYIASLNPSWFDRWNGGLDFGFNLTTGNTRTNTLSLGSNLSRQTSRDKTTLYAAFINAKNKDNGVTQTTANAIRGGGRYEIGLTKRLNAFGFADFEYNEIQLLDLRSVLGGGLGYYLIKNDRMDLQAFGGGSWNRENFSTGLRRNSGEVLAGQELTLRLNSRVLFKERLQYFPNLTETGEYRLTFDSSLATKLTSWMTWNVTVSDRYLSNPPPGSKNNDLLFTTGVGVSLTNFSFR